MEQNGRVKEMRERLQARFGKAFGLQGRWAVVASSVTAVLLLLLGGLVFASQDARVPDALADRTKSAVSSRSASTSGDGDALTKSPEQAPSASPLTTSTTVITTSPAAVPPADRNENTANTTATTVVTGQPATPTTSQASPTPTTTPPAATPPTTTAASTPTQPPRTVPTNGRLLPTVAALIGSASTEDPNLSLKINAGDKDGYVSRIVVNWDDGTMPTVIPYPLSACVEPLSTSLDTTASHTYDTAGSYTVTVTVTSVSCAGDGEQQTIGVVNVSVGGSSTPPVSSTSSTTTAAASS
jgi:PKD repeat protein